MERRKLRIGELALHLDVERFVIRFWEKEFGIKPKRSSGGQRYYSKRDIKKFEAIRHLLHDKKFTIAGAKQMLDKQSDNAAFTASAITSLPIASQETQQGSSHHHLMQQLQTTREKLCTIRDILSRSEPDSS